MGNGHEHAHPRLTEQLVAHAIHLAMDARTRADRAADELRRLAGPHPVALRMALAKIVRALDERPSAVGARAEELVRAALAHPDLADLLGTPSPAATDGQLVHLARHGDPEAPRHGRAVRAERAVQVVHAERHLG